MCSSESHRRWKERVRIKLQVLKATSGDNLIKKVPNAGENKYFPIFTTGSNYPKLYGTSKDLISWMR